MGTRLVRQRLEPREHSSVRQYGFLSRLPRYRIARLSSVLLISTSFPHFSHVQIQTGDSPSAVVHICRELCHC